MRYTCDRCPQQYRCTLDGDWICHEPVFADFSKEDERRLKEHLAAAFARLFCEAMHQDPEVLS